MTTELRFAYVGRNSLIASLLVLGLVPVHTFAQDTPPETITIGGIIRDFRPNHPDFNVTPSNGYGHVMGNIDRKLDDDGKPVLVGGGFRVGGPWRDGAHNRKIADFIFDPDIDNVEGVKGEDDDGAITSEDTFAQWFRDVPGVNMSGVYRITLTLQSDGMYEYLTSDFYPIDDLLLGNGDDSKNYFFTYEIEGDFTYDASKNQVFTFFGDDDVWVFIDGKLVIDLGGVVGNTTQHIDLDRLELDDGKVYRLSFFMAERHQPKSQFRFMTNVLLSTDNIIPTVLAAYD